MKTFIKTSVFVIALTFASVITKAQCLADFNWSQPSNNVIAFTNTSIPQIPNSTYFYWTFGDGNYGYTTNPSNTYNVPGTYVVCLNLFDSLSTCTAQFCDTITVTGNVICNISAYAQQTQLATCITCPDGAAAVNPIGGTAPYTYLWSNGETTQTATMLLPGPNTVCVTDVNGCQACDSISIVYSNSSGCQASFSWSQTQNNVVDFTSTSTGVYPGTYYYWNFGNNQYGYSSQVSNTYMTPGTYTVCLTIYDSLSFCQSTFCDTITVYGNVICSAYTNAYVAQSATCVNCPDGIGYASMTGGTGPYTYTWSSGGTGQFEYGLAPGSYTVCITDANGCIACDTLIMQFTNSSGCNASFTWSQTNPNEIDFTSTSTGGSPQTVYFWNFGDNTSSYGTATNVTNLYANPGTYTVCLTMYDSATFCSHTFCDVITVTGTPSSTNCTANFIIFPDSVNTSQAWGYNLSTGGPGMTYQWFWGDNTPIDTAQYPTHVYTSTGSYNICLVVVDIANQCTDTLCQLLWVPRLSQAASLAPYFVNIIPQGPQSVHEMQATSFSIYPNPAQNELKIKSDFALNGNNFRVLDVTGRVVISGKLTGNSIDVSEFDHGMYILQIENKGEISSQRFMKN